MAMKLSAPLSIGVILEDKYLQMNIISETDTIAIITEMCRRVGADPDKLDLTKKDWFLDFEWTQEQEDDFIIWLGMFLKKEKYVKQNKKRGIDAGLYEARKIVGNIGWKTKTE